ncbi:MAG: hypothetical protein RTV31_13200 [Candidatus Thorarchaeota archaeon]
MTAEDEPTKEALIAMLGRERAKQHKIFRENMGRGTNPDGSDEYWEAKKKFDTADRIMKAIEKELANLQTEPEYYDETIWDKLAWYWNKLTGDDDAPTDWGHGTRG